MPKTFPYLEVSGTHKDLGTAIGKMFRPQIQEIIREYRETVPEYQQLLAQVPPYIASTQNAFPQLVEEAEAIAAAAEVPFLEYFFINNDEVYSPDAEWVGKNEALADHCTIAVSFNAHGAVVGHNEDWSLAALKYLYVLKATVNGTSFLGLQYGVGLAGVAATINNWGLVQCINSLYHTPQVGVPKNFLARAVLECKTLDEAENLIRKTKRASGFNHVLVQNHEARNIEIADNIISVDRVNQGSYVHTNHYLSPELKSFEKFHTKSSDARYLRATQLAHADMTKEEMVALLSDTQDSQFPICRPDHTVGSLIFIPATRQVWICYGHPCASEYIKYEI